MKIAIIGTGRMGTGLAKRLMAGGHQVVVWNRSAARTAEAVSAGASAATSVAEAVYGADVAMTSLSNDAAVREVAIGPSGLLARLGRGVTYVETSTISPGLSAELAQARASHLALPVLGGPASVESGQATYLAGGDPGTIDHLGPVLDSLGGTLRTFPTARLASVAKLVVNQLMLCGIAALAESFTTGRDGGLDDDQLRELLGGAVSSSVRNRFEALLGAPAAGWWATALGAKDVGLALDVARSAGHELPLSSAARDAYLKAAAMGHADEDVAAVRYAYPH